MYFIEICEVNPLYFQDHYIRMEDIKVFFKCLSFAILSICYLLG